MRVSYSSNSVKSFLIFLDGLNGTTKEPSMRKGNKVFKIFGIIFAIGTAWFVLGPANLYADYAAMVLFGLGVGALMVYLGGLMAVDICSKEASGAALGAIGVASYIGAGIQDVISGQLINDAAVIVDGETIYNFDAAGTMWIGSAVVSLVLAIFVWNAKSPD